jgi:L-threonylcarbamoyladenylate synthase
MRIFDRLTSPDVIQLLKDGAIGVIPTDTVYGIVASADNEMAVNRLYATRPRDPEKACIVLIGNLDQITDVAAWHDADVRIIERYWPGPVTIALPITDRTPSYLHRREQTMAYRLPDFPDLQKLLLQAGPVIAPSANPEGLPPATTLAEAQAYFDDRVDFYVDGGTLTGQPSTLIRPDHGKVIVLRQGAKQINVADLL